MSSPHVKAENLAFAYADGTWALRNVSFVVESGESVGVVGANGAGKSTLLMHLVGCLLPAEGDLFIAGVRLEKSAVPALRQRVGLVFQNPDDQLFMPTVREDVAFGPRNQGLSEHEVAHRVQQTLLAVNANHLIDRPPYRLSGGEKRVVSIATVLAMMPDILVLDEPTAGLDPGNRRCLIQLLRTLDHTQIIASHDLDLILDTCQRVIVMHQGRIVADGPCRQVLYDASLLTRCGLELPLSVLGTPRHLG